MAGVSDRRLTSPEATAGARRAPAGASSQPRWIDAIGRYPLGPFRAAQIFGRRPSEARGRDDIALPRAHRRHLDRAGFFGKPALGPQQVRAGMIGSLWLC